MKDKAMLVRRLLVLIVLLAVACSGFAAESLPKNVILIIGDGMGVGAITAARCAGPGENGALTLDTMPVTGLVKTHPEKVLVTDSAAAGTALATGHKTENGRIAVDAEGKSLPTILELAVDLGKSTAVITTDGVASATPAVFYAHVPSRGMTDVIAEQLVASKITVAMGSGRGLFLPRLAAQIAQNGFDVALDANTMEASQGKRLLGLFSFDASGPTLAAMLNKAVSVLSADPDGFFMMAESCLPDKGGHSNNLQTVLKGVADLEAALRSALEFAKKDGQTLVLVTSDHDTGGLAVLDRGEKDPLLTPGWVGTGHTGNMVPIYAFGPGAERFCGTHDNTEIPKIVAALWGRTLGQSEQAVVRSLKPALCAGG